PPDRGRRREPCLRPARQDAPGAVGGSAPALRGGPVVPAASAREVHERRQPLLTSPVSGSVASLRPGPYNFRTHVRELGEPCAWLRPHSSTPTPLPTATRSS